MATGLEETLGFGITKAMFSAMAKPALESGFKGLKSLTSGTIDLFVNKFSEYLELQTNRHSYLSTIVFGHQKPLHELYVPLSVVPIEGVGTPNETGALKIDRFRKEFLPENPKVLVTDTAGMGKSTLSKFLFIQCIRSAYAIPFFIELRLLSATVSVATFIQQQLNNFDTEDTKFSKAQVERLFKKGGLVLFLDGYDEVPVKDRETVTHDIKMFIEKFPSNTYVITSRPETGLLSFPNFKQYTIRPLQRRESFDLIRRYDQGCGRAEQLISKLDNPEYRPVQEFLKNPLLTTLLYRSFEYKQSVPLKKHLFYRQVFDALFEWHDASKDGYNTRQKKCGLDMDGFHRVLRVIGFMSVMKNEIEGGTDKVLGWIRKAKEVCQLTNMSESAFLEDIVKAVPLFVRDGDHYRWSHKSLAEYFAAQYLCTDGKNQQGKILSAILQSGEIVRFGNVLDQVYDIDIVGFKQHLILPLAKAFSSYWESSYQGMKAEIPVEQIRLRRAASFDTNLIGFSFNIKQTKENLDEFVKNAIITATGVPLQDLVPVRLGLVSRSTMANSQDIVACVPGRFKIILEILHSKKDPLVINRLMLEPADGAPKIKFRDKSVLFDDNPESEYNQPGIFPKVTQLFVNTGTVIDSNAMLGFESSFNDLARIAGLAEELLAPIQARSGA